MSKKASNTRTVLPTISVCTFVKIKIKITTIVCFNATEHCYCINKPGIVFNMLVTEKPIALHLSSFFSTKRRCQKMHSWLFKIKAKNADVLFSRTQRARFTFTAKYYVLIINLIDGFIPSA